MHSGLILPPLGTSHSSSNSSSSFGVLPSKWGSAAVTTFPTAVLASTGAYEAEHDAARASLTSASSHKNPIQLQEFMGNRADTGKRASKSGSAAVARSTMLAAEGVPTGARKACAEARRAKRTFESIILPAGGELRKRKLRRWVVTGVVLLEKQLVCLGDRAATCDGGVVMGGP